MKVNLILFTWSHINWPFHWHKRHLLLLQTFNFAWMFLCLLFFLCLRCHHDFMTKSITSLPLTVIIVTHDHPQQHSLTEWTPSVPCPVSYVLLFPWLIHFQCPTSFLLIFACHGHFLSLSLSLSLSFSLTIVGLNHHLLMWTAWLLITLHQKCVSYPCTLHLAFSAIVPLIFSPTKCNFVHAPSHPSCNPLSPSLSRFFFLSFSFFLTSLWYIWCMCMCVCEYVCWCVDSLSWCTGLTERVRGEKWIDLMIHAI